MTKKIHFILTGGTIDSYYDAAKDTAVPNKESIISEFIASMQLYIKAVYTTVCMKDSRDMKPKDIKKVLNAIEKSPHKKIIITHGTYTMPDTARYIKENIKRDDQTIILTASAIPIKGFSPSDGPFNLGYAMAKLDHLESGVYVAINGKVFLPEEVMKIMSEARFTSLFNR